MADCLAATTKQDSFVSQKKCRDMRGGKTINTYLTHILSSVLFGKWERLQGRVQDCLEQSEQFESLKQEVLSLKTELVALRDQAEEEEGEEDGGLEQRLQSYKV